MGSFFKKQSIEALNLTIKCQQLVLTKHYRFIFGNVLLSIAIFKFQVFTMVNPLTLQYLPPKPSASLWDWGWQCSTLKQTGRQRSHSLMPTIPLVPAILSLGLSYNMNTAMLNSFLRKEAAKTFLIPEWLSFCFCVLCYSINQATLNTFLHNQFVLFE